MLYGGAGDRSCSVIYGKIQKMRWYGVTHPTKLAIQSEHLCSLLLADKTGDKLKLWFTYLQLKKIFGKSQVTG